MKPKPPTKIPSGLVVIEPTHLKNYAPQIGSFSQLGMKIKHIWNHLVLQIQAWFELLFNKQLYNIFVYANISCVGYWK